MATIGGYNVVTDGLVLSLDAANPRSYVSGSTTWGDLSGNNYLGTATTPLYSSSFGGSFLFSNNTTNIFSIPNVVLNTNGGVTLESFTYLTSSSYANGIGNPNGIIGHRSGSTTALYAVGINPNGTYGVGFFQYPFGSVNGFSYSSVDTWYHTIWVQTPTNVYQYVNGVLVYSFSFTFTLPSLTTSSNFIVGRWIGGSSQPLYGNIASFRYYNRALSAQEVLQNYNATKGRFGL